MYSITLMNRDILLTLIEPRKISSSSSSNVHAGLLTLNTISVAAVCHMMTCKNDVSLLIKCDIIIENMSILMYNVYTYI